MSRINHVILVGPLLCGFQAFSADDWKKEALKLLAAPAYSGKYVKACVNDDCVESDRYNEGSRPSASEGMNMALPLPDVAKINSDSGKDTESTMEVEAGVGK
jgi:hypothetical protein